MTDHPRRSYVRSEALLARALEVMPLGAQTFSKSITQYPRGAAPFFAERAAGSRLYDVDGNEYVDFNNALCAVTLGHCDPDVTSAVMEQLKKGTIFSLSSDLEIAVSERIIDLVPCAEMVRFGKNGSDATAGAIRAARAFTQRNRVAVCGYHGWQDWYIGSTSRNKGVPPATRELTHTFGYNDIASLERLLKQYPGEFAAIIIEPMASTWPVEGFLQQVCDRGRAAGAVVVFDETITGFRFAPGGAQEYFGVVPDLACFGKGLANGYPLSAVAGRRDIMAVFEEIFFSFTMGGETLSLVAALASLDKLVREDVPHMLARRGGELADGLTALIDRHNCGEFIAVNGHPSWTFLTITEKPAQQFGLKTLFMQEILDRGFLTLGTHNMSLAHSESDVAALLGGYDEVLPILRSAFRSERIEDFLRCKPLEPLFRVR